MSAPTTIKAAGYFSATRAGHELGELTLRMQTPTKGTLEGNGQKASVVGDVAAKTITGKFDGVPFNLKITKLNLLKGKLGNDAFVLTRQVLRPIPANEMLRFDAGPTGAITQIMAATPDYLEATGDASIFWHHFGNLFYRGRLDGSARILCIASDPGPTECLPFVRRTLMGDSGQKTQGFLTKLGLTRGYVLVNAMAVAMRPSAKEKGLQVIKSNQAIMQSRHDFYNHLLTVGSLQAIVAFGEVAQLAYELWRKSNPAVKTVPVLKLAHPAAVDRSGSGNDQALKGWVSAIKKLRPIVTPDADGDATSPNFGDYFTELDYARIPRWDLPKVAPAYVGDDSWGRAARRRHNNCCERPSPDDRKSLILTTPGGQWLRYEFKNGKLQGAKNKQGATVAVDSNGIELG